MRVGSDFSGVGAFDQALKRLGVNYETVFACDMDKYARDTFIHNYGEPKYYPTNVYDREIPTESLDIYMTSPPCQAFSLAGKRLGKDDKRGVLFFNSHEFIQVNKPRFFIFENVKGLLSDDGGKTFQEWVNMLGGKSVNGLPVLFAHDDAVPYHLYWKVLNAKHHGVPQNRERVFLIGIRDDVDNQFQFPKEEHLDKRLKDVLEDGVDDKYFLSEERIGTITKAERGIGWTDAETKNTANCVLTGYAKNPTDGEYLKIKSATSKGYEEAREGDSINFSVPSSETQRGRVGKGVAQTLDTGCNQGVMQKYQKEIEQSLSQDVCTTIDASYYKGFGVRQGKCRQVVNNNYRIRRLTPRECFRLMDFPDTFTWKVSDSQAYKQAGNSIVVNVLYKILKQLPL
jgi:DNA (cytosine-5)-methyltransferase 1